MSFINRFPQNTSVMKYLVVDKLTGELLYIFETYALALRFASALEGMGFQVMVLKRPEVVENGLPGIM